MHSAAHTLESWLDQQYARSAQAMLVSVSPVGLIKERPGFGQTLHPVKGSIIASPVLADWNPEPDYFFHWFRDSAVVIEALRLLRQSGDIGPIAQQHLADFVSFSLALQSLDGRKIVTNRDWREAAAPEFVKFLRPDEELAAVRGDNVVVESRVNPDGTLDISRWSRPQHDGPSLRALAVLRWVRAASLESGLEARAARLIRSDLAFTFTSWRRPSFDIWEEENGLHYYTLCVSAAALDEGASWLEESS